MSFAVAAEAYDRFMGRYSTPLAPRFLDFAKRRQRAGAGRRLRTGSAHGGAGRALRRTTRSPRPIPPSRSSLPRASVTPASAWSSLPRRTLPFEDAEFAAALAQLVVHFMSDPVAGIHEMARVTREVTALSPRACGTSQAERRRSACSGTRRGNSTGDVIDESKLAGAREGHLAELCEAAGLREVEDGAISIAVEHATFDEWWEPFTLGVGPAGAYVAALEEDERAALRDRVASSSPTNRSRCTRAPGRPAASSSLAASPGTPGRARRCAR